MKVLINICAHDGIISHYTGVGTMVKKYIKSFMEILTQKNIDFDLNLFTPQYNKYSFGFNEKTAKEHKNLKKVKIYEVSNGSNGKINYGTIDNWQELCINTAKVMNSIPIDIYDKVVTVYNDTPFACLSKYLENNSKHLKILILHSTVKIHKVDSAIKNSELLYDARLKWEENAIDYINKHDNNYLGAIGNFIKDHLIKEYGLNYKKIIDIYNGELLDEPNKSKYSTKSKELYKKIQNYDTLLLSYGRAEEYKNLSVTFYLGKYLKIPTVVIAQLYYKDQPISIEYKRIAKETNGLLFLDPPFDFASYILSHFKKKLICLVPSKKEIQGLIINEIRKKNKKNILIVSNNIDGLKDQIIDCEDGLLVDLNDIEKSGKKIEKYLDKNIISRISREGYKSLQKKYNFMTNAEEFLNYILK